MSLLAFIQVHAPAALLRVLVFGLVGLTACISRLMLFDEVRRRLPGVSIWLWTSPPYLELLYLRHRGVIGSRRLDAVAIIAAVSVPAFIVAFIWL